MKIGQTPLVQSEPEQAKTVSPAKRLEYQTPVLEHHGSLQTITGSPMIIPIGPGSNGP
jgi:hypothetical protein